MISIHNGSTSFTSDDISFLEDLARVSALALRAFHHEMTLLPTRALLNELLDREIEKRANGLTAEPLALAYMDLDGFGDINKKFGHDAGDQVISAFAARLIETLDGDAIPCHLHGDEFAVILRQHSELDAARICESIRQTVATTPFVVRASQTPIQLTASIGYSKWTAEARDAFIDRADSASNLAKVGGRNRVERA